MPRAETVESKFRKLGLTKEEAEKLAESGLNTPKMVKKADTTKMDANTAKIVGAAKKKLEKK